MFTFKSLIYGCLMFSVPLHCCQNLTLPNVPTRCLLPNNPTTAPELFPLDAFVNNLLRPIDPINQNVQRWLRMDHTPGAVNWITVITERSIRTHFDGLRTKLLLDFLRLFDTSFPKKRKKSCFFEISKKTIKYVFSNTG